MATKTLADMVAQGDKQALGQRFAAKRQQQGYGPEPAMDGYGPGSMKLERPAVVVPDEPVRKEKSAGKMFCRCGNFEVQRRTITKGFQTGQEFFCCDNPQAPEKHCDYFEWVKNDEVGSTGVGSRGSSRLGDIYGSGDQNTENVQIPNCKCGMPVVRREVKKAGPNEGKPFYVCAQPQGSQCRFWEWADSFNASSSGVESINGGNSGANSGGGSDAGIGSSVCYKCKKPGHWANECPNSRTHGNFAGGGGGGGGGGFKCHRCKQYGHYANRCPNQ